MDGALTLTLDAPPAVAPARPTPAKAWLKALEMTGRVDAQPRRLLAHVIEDMAGERPDAPALLSRNESFTYGELAARTRRYVRWALANDAADGEVTALLMPNRPEYVAVWLGICRVGGVVALLNTNLSGDALAHCVRAAQARTVIVDAALEPVLRAALAGEASPPRILVHGGDGPAAQRLDEALEAFSCEPLSDAETPEVALHDRALLIYTSGTTGLPKAANVSHHRVMSWSGWFAGMAHMTPADRLYNCLPMYHSTGGVAATGAALMAGASVFIRERFSASAFWPEVVETGCTIFQYIGELCRYLTAAPPSPFERRHRLRLACGNGLRPDVWRAFEQRFAIPWILEFYASTEGNFSLFNAEGEPGAVGRVPGFMRHRFPAAIVRHDPQTETPIRDGDGRCVRCAAGEAGEAIGRIGGSGDLAQRFEGYTDAQANDRKLLRDVFEPGDAWLRTGDLMLIDAQGFWRFVDRIGDTFRWKGENVSTTEVADVIGACPGVEAAVVYGVEVPGCDGRAGMAAIVASAEGLDPAVLYAWVEERLPRYARPVFVRLVDELEVTGTFKTRKQDLIREGFDPAVIADQLWIADERGEAYAPLTLRGAEEVEAQGFKA